MTILVDVYKRQIDRLLPHALDLVAEDERIPHARLGTEVAEHRGPLDLLDGKDRAARGPQTVETLRRGGVIAPRDGQFGAQRRLVDIAVGRRGRDAAQADALRGEGVARAEKGPHVLQRTDVVEHHRDCLLYTSRCV